MDWIQIVSSLGFPVVACGAMGWYVKYITDKSREDTQELNKRHTEEMLAFKDEIKEALNNNTLALNRLCEKLGGEEVKVYEKK